MSNNTTKRISKPEVKRGRGKDDSLKRLALHSVSNQCVVISLIRLETLFVVVGGSLGRYRHFSGYFHEPSSPLPVVQIKLKKTSQLRSLEKWVHSKITKANENPGRRRKTRANAASKNTGTKKAAEYRRRNVSDKAISSSLVILSRGGVAR